MRSPMTGIDHAIIASSRHPPALPARVLSRLGSSAHRPVVAARRRRPVAGAASGSPESAGATQAALRRARPSGSSICTCPARRRTSTCSTTSRSWSSATARTAPTSSSRASGSRSPPACRSCWARRSTFKQHGKAGVWMSDAMPHLHEVADELCVIRSMNTDQFNHAPAELLLYTGSPRPGRPSMRLVGHLRPRHREREPARVSSC